MTKESEIAGMRIRMEEVETRHFILPVVVATIIIGLILLGGVALGFALRCASSNDNNRPHPPGRMVCDGLAEDELSNTKERR